MELFRSASTHNAARDTSEEAGPLLEDGTEKAVEKELRSANGQAHFPHLPAIILDNLSHIGTLRRLRPLHVTKRILICLVPSFLHAKLTGEPKDPEKLFPTAHLDGLRGVAALFVFFGHLSYGSFDVLTGFGSTPDTWHVLQLPIVRIIYSGHGAVAIFFVISGYALSIKPIKQMRSGAYDGLLQTVSSTAFRRGFRLFLPTLAATFLLMFAVWLGLFEVTRPLATSKVFLRNFMEFHKPRKETFALQFRDWFVGMSRYFYVWDNYRIYAGSIDYDLHLWTIPVEFRASMVLLVTHVALARLQPRWRILCLLLLNWFALQWTRWEMCLFWCGALLAEYDMIMNILKDNAPQDSTIRRVVASHVWFWWWIVAFVLGIFLCCYPEKNSESSPGYMYLDSLVPPAWDARVNQYNQRFRLWIAVGAVLLMWSINNLKVLSNLFTGPVIHYLGKISYALYLTHGLVIHTFGYYMMMFFWAITGFDTEFRYVLGWTLSATFIIPTCIVVADWFWRAVDIPTVRFARWLESSMIAHF